MRAIIDAALELRLIRHEIEASVAVVPTIFSQWSAIRAHFFKMGDYLRWLQADFRMHYKPISELQRVAEHDRNRQPDVWDAIRKLDSVRDLIADIDDESKNTRYYKDYFSNYEEALKLMIAASLHGALPPDPTARGAPQRLPADALGPGSPRHPGKR
jgi:hypothetical protein